MLIAQALFQRPDVLLLDEPTNHLDLEAVMYVTNPLTRVRKGYGKERHARATPTYSDAKVANRNAEVWHGATENGPLNDG